MTLEELREMIKKREDSKKAYGTLKVGIILGTYFLEVYI